MNNTDHLASVEHSPKCKLSPPPMAQAYNGRTMCAAAPQKSLEMAQGM